MTKVSNNIQEDIVKMIVLDKDKTPIYDFECDHDADENYWYLYTIHIHLYNQKDMLSTIVNFKFVKLILTLTNSYNTGSKDDR